MCIITPVESIAAIFDTFNKTEYHPGRCPTSVCFNIPLLIIFCVLSKLICHTELRLIGSTSFGFKQNFLHHFQNTVYELIVALSLISSSTIATKKNKNSLSKVTD